MVICSTFNRCVTIVLTSKDEIVTIKGILYNKTIEEISSKIVKNIHILSSHGKNKIF